LLTFRSAAAGFYDLDRRGGTGNFGGFKSGCTSNLVAADGVLNAPDYTRTCTCSYQNQTSLALVHMSEVETWTFNNYHPGEDRIRYLGVNLGAPGDRRTDDGTLWIEYPFVGGPGPHITVTTEPEAPDWFYRHSLRLKGNGLKWVGGSGVRGLRTLTISLVNPLPPPGLAGAEPEPIEPPKVDDNPYTVRLHFAEPDDLPAGARIMDVSVQGRSAFKALDVSAEAGGADRVLVKTLRNVAAGNTLTITLTPSAGTAETLLCGVELLAEGW
jgi:hypothetical protein